MFVPPKSIHHLCHARSNTIETQITISFAFIPIRIPTMIHSLSARCSSSSCGCSDQISIQNPNLTPRSKTLISLPPANRCSKPLLVLRSCRASLGNDDDRFLQASLLVSETIRHYSLWKQGFVENTRWHLPGQSHLHSHRRKVEKSDASLIGPGILRQFQSPTIFLKIACDGDLLLPIVVGEFAISQLISALSDDQHEECPDQLQFAKNIVLKFGYEVNMVRITERIVNTYHACIYLGKRTKDVNISIDARPSDAINVAERSKAPIYVSKEIVLKDAIKIVYGKWRATGKTVYDVSLDSAVEGHDPLAEEISMIQKMKTAVLEERYQDAAAWRDKIANLRMQS